MFAKVYVDYYGWNWESVFDRSLMNELIFQRHQEKWDKQCPSSFSPKTTLNKNQP